MKLSLVTVQLLAAAVLSQDANQTHYGDVPPCQKSLELAFKEFMTKYGRVYGSRDDEQKRFQIFGTNYKLMEASNANNRSFSLAVNEFADQSAAEFKATRFGMMQPPVGKLWAGLQRLGTHKYRGTKLPASVDWSTKGAVTPLKNQRQCGSCWAFSTTGALEGAWKIASGKLVSLNEQQLVDCSTENHGCNGGSMDLAFDFLKNHSACTEDSYDYEGKADKCHASKCKVGIPSGSVTGFKDVPADDMNALMEAVSQQPVSVAIEADQTAFQMYHGGILTKKCGNKLDHGVLVVGYGSDKGIDYWKVKNSWGGAWGEDGFIRIERGLPKSGECGIKSAASYPVVHAPKEVQDTVIVV
jgi:C1A family cysteine protease